MTAPRRALGDDRGMAAVEAAIVAPVLIAMLLLVVVAGRISEADGTIRRAASEAARAAYMASGANTHTQSEPARVRRETHEAEKKEAASVARSGPSLGRKRPRRAASNATPIALPRCTNIRCGARSARKWLCFITIAAMRFGHG